jgi:hypothetical protein
MEEMGMKTLRTMFGTAVMMVFISLTALPAFTEDKPADNMDIVREKIRADKKLMVSEEMELTEKEANAFWPVYERYQKDLQRINDRTLALIKEYSENYKTMTDAMAKKLLGDMLKIETDRLNLKRSYLLNFEKALPAKKVARYYQIENKIEAVVKYELAKAIPLVK